MMITKGRSFCPGINARHVDWPLVKACRNCLSPSSRRFSRRRGTSAREWHHDTWGLAGAGSSIRGARGSRARFHVASPLIYQATAGPIADMPGPSLGLLKSKLVWRGTSRLSLANIPPCHWARPLPRHVCGFPGDGDERRVGSPSRRYNAGLCFAGANTRLCASSMDTGSPRFCWRDMSSARSYASGEGV